MFFFRGKLLLNRIENLTLSLRPRAAATKNKIRKADNAYIFFIGVKNNPWQGLCYRFY
jgi:hypothetical protein